MLIESKHQIIHKKFFEKVDNLYSLKMLSASGIYFLTLNAGSPWAKGPGSLGTLVP